MQGSADMSQKGVPAGSSPTSSGLRTQPSVGLPSAQIPQEPPKVRCVAPATRAGASHPAMHDRPFNQQT